jgi:hypothetical protein
MNAVAPKLVAKVFYVVELLFRAKEAHKFDFDMLAVKIFRKIENMRLQKFLWRRKGWANAKIRHGIEDTAVREMYSSGINSVRRLLGTYVHHIGRWETKLPADLVAVQDLSPDFAGDS